MSSYVYVKNPNGKTYVYENTTYWDKEAKKSRHKRKCIGHLDSKTGEIVPNHTKKDRQEKQDKNTEYCSITSAGIEMLLNKASEDIKLTSVLKEVFPDDWKSILTCAYYIVSEGGTLSYTPVWQKTFPSPCRDLLSGEEISKLISRITPSLQDKFFEKWAHMNIQEDYCIMSLTSFFSYDELTDNMHYGYNLDYRSFPQQNMLMFCGAQNKMPLYYKLISRETREVKTFQDKLKNLPLPKGKSVHFIMDKTYCSRSNIDAFSESDSKFIMIVPFTVNFARDIVDEFHDKIRKPDNYFRIPDGHIYADTKQVIINGHKLYVHVYYNENKALSYERRFEYLLYSCKNEIVSGNLVKEHAAYYEQYFNIEESDDGLKVEYNKEAIEEKKHTPVGWFVLITNDITDKIRALRLYMAKDRTDKYFDDIMSKENMKGIHFYDFSTIEGRIFIQFIALIIRIRLQQVLSESDMSNEYDLDDVLREVKTIYTVNPENGRKKYITKPNKLQENIMKLYGLM